MRRGLALLAWGVVSAALLALHALRLRRTRALLARATHPSDAGLRRRVARLAREAGIDAPVRVLETDRLTSPAVAGAVRPAVLLPAGLAEELRRDALDWILRHELEHVRRRDVLVSALRALWFAHPAVWLAPRAVRRARELACDEAALARGHGAAGGPEAANALLHVLERDGNRAEARLTGAIPLTRTDPLERQRIMRLLRDTTPRRRLGALPAAGIGAASVLLLASGLRPVPRAGHPTPIAPQDAATPVQVAAPDSAEEALAGALRYLVENQQPDGRWRAVAGRDGGAAGEFDDVGVTGVALQALARGPKGLDVEGRVEAVQRGLAWLASRHDVERGAFKLPERSVHMLPSHAMATLGWSVAHARLGTLRDQATLDVLQGAVEFVSRARNPYRGWRYAYPPDGQSDAMVTGWMLLVLRVADDLGLRYDEDGVRDGLTLFEDHYSEGTGRVGYRMAGDPTPRFPSKKDSYPPDAVELPTAVAMTAKFAWDADPIEDPMMLKSAFLLLDHAPLWSRSRGTIDSYYWAFGTLAIRPYGGVFAQRWSAALIEAVTDHADETPTGSIHWAAVDAWHDEGGEVPMTAMCALALAAAIGD